MKLDEVQQAAQEQFAKQNHRYGQGNSLENVEDVSAAFEQLNFPCGLRTSQLRPERREDPLQDLLAETALLPFVVGDLRRVIPVLLKNPRLPGRKLD